MSNKLIFAFIGMFILVGALFPMVSAIDNFNISSSISSEPLFFLNGTTGDVAFGFNVSAGEDFCLKSGICLSSLDSLEIGEISLSGSLVPTMDNQFDLGEGDMRWKSLYLGTSLINNGSAYFGGNVGIGTTTPSQKLDVAGNINIDGTSAYLYDGHNAIKLATKGDTIDYTSTIIGREAGDTKTDGTTIRQTAVGYNAGYSNSGTRQTALGNYAGQSNTGDYQTAVGYYAGQSNTGTRQTALG